MPQLKVVRPTEVYVYECDRPGCDRLCENEAVAYQGGRCDWIGFEDYTQRNATGHATRLWFCGFICLSTWALDKSRALDESGTEKAA